MHFKSLGLFKKVYLTTFSLLFITCTAQAEDITIDLGGASSAWKAIMKGSNFDPNGDTQAGAEAVELVGDADHSVLYTLYDDQGTVTNADDSIAYRIRLGGTKDSAVYVIGIDANLDGKIDLFLNANGKQNGRAIEFVDPGNGANISPNTTSMENNSSFEIAYTGLNYNFDSVQTIDGNSVTTDIGPNGKLDHFISFEFPFSDLQTEMVNIAGLNVDENTIMQYILVSLTQSSSINGDVGGIDDKVDDWDATYADLGMLSPPLSLSNLAPVISNDGSAATSSLNVSENTTAVTDIVATDPENDSITFSISGGVDSSFFSIDNSGALVFVSAPDFETPLSNAGSNAYIVEVSASDGALADTQTITVNVQDINEGGGNIPPTISGTPATTIAENSNYGFSPTFNDADGDALTFSISNKPDWATFNTADGSLTGTPGFTDAGTYSNIVISVSDGGTPVSLPTFSISVTETNQAPTISGTPATTIAENSNYGFSPTFNDADGDALTFSISNKPDWATFNTADGSLTGTPGFTDAGTYSNIVISVSDGGTPVSLPAFSISVTNTNQAPTISGTPATTIAENSNYGFSPTFNDADGDALTFSISNKPDWATFNTADGSLTGTPGFTDAGTYSNIVISVSDGGTPVSLPTFSISVTETNQAPTISGTPATTIAENSNYGFSPTFNDADGDALTFSISNKPDWATFNTADGSLTGTPGFTDAGTYSNIVISVSDGGTPVSLPTFSISVTNTNQAPTISGMPATTIAENSNYGFSPTFNDADGDALTFSISNKPDWATFNTADGSLTGTPGFTDAGTYSNIVISVSDGGTPVSLPAFSISVTNTNQAPTISGTPVTTIAENSNYGFSPTFNDADGDTLTFSISNKPAWATFNTADGSLTGTPGFTDAGTYSNIVISVSDGGTPESLPAFSISVTNTNQAPTISGTPASTIAENSNYGFSPTFNDADGDALTFSISNKPDWATFNTADGSLTGTPGFTDAGTYSNIVISVSDGGTPVSLPAFSISVTETNQAPTISGTPATTIAENSNYGFSPTFNDADGDSLLFSITNKPSWADFDTATGALNGTPGFSDAGDYNNIQISVTDADDTVSLPAFNINVTETNQRPTADSLTIDVVENIAIEIALSGLDEDADELTFNIVNAPENGGLSGASPTFTYSPNTDFVGSDSFTINANDGTEDSEIATITINVLADLDKDGIPNITDDDTDGDGISDTEEGIEDTDGDGTANYLDLDSDGDGISDLDEGTNDSDGDGIEDYLDSTVDEDNDGIPDIVEGTDDSDNDGIRNHLDSDSDNDGIPDSREANISGKDTDNDGIDDTFDVDQTGGTDINNDGIDDDVQLQDTDNDGIPDHTDNDSDNDAIPDVIEAHLRLEDVNNNGINDLIDVELTLEVDLDSDGIDDAFDVTYTDGIDANLDGIDDILLPLSDRDNDGTPDHLDLDSDNDGISDTVEAGMTGLDYDGDGIDDNYDVDATNGTDTNNDGIDDNATVVDTDVDGVPDLHDLDSDNDSIFDVTEAGATDLDNDALVDLENVLVEIPLDSDNDGISDFRDIDSDNDSINDIDTTVWSTLDENNDGQIDSSVDNDGDGIDDAQDMLPEQHGTAKNNNDQDVDGIPDTEEGVADTDGDGVPNYLDTDSDNDGIPDSDEGTTDTDGDGEADYIDTDSDNDGIPDVEEGTTDTDDDGNADYIDTDSDNDGIPDVDEGTNDTDGDGDADYTDTDSDNDGIPDVDEGSNDTDGDGEADYIDTDSDNDGIPDVDEGSNDTDGDGDADYIDTDSDNDGIPDVDEGTNDTDGDGEADYIDTDSDNDGIPDVDEGTLDTDGDGIPDYLDSDLVATDINQDSDSDGILDSDEGTVDTDGDGTPDYLDTDSDNDGILDSDENGDFNNDGINDRLQASGKVETGVKGAGATGFLAIMLLIFIVLIRSSKKFTLILLAAPLLLISNAQASDNCELGKSFTNVNCWYAGAGLGYSTLDPKHKNTSWRVSDDNDTSFKLLAGLALSDHLFTEISYEDMGAAELYNLNPSITDTLNIDYSAFGANVGFWLNERKSTWNVYAKAGVSFLDTDTGENVEQDHGTQLTFGAGAQWHFNEKWFARLELTAYDEDAQVIGLSISRYFGSTTKAMPKKKTVKKAPIHKPTPVAVVEEVVTVNPDLDNDGVINESDKCPETIANTKVNAKGCALMATITLKIQFDSWKSNVKEQYLAEIDRVAKFIDQHDEIDVVVEGHTDWEGKEDKNQILSEARAKAVATLLEEKTPNSDKTYTTIGFGELKPIADNTTKEGRRLNRRVVVVISEK
ncbi:putative Ig domain-containing protein [Thalassotalea fonticola]|uniref:Ig domain-containing protein n=1 Tax=Thalassotalea fonticola TaxID=3065649 RepID=A0ABZ0GQX2_9GAMM|nr:putative Ig domain-containing protein [Colwelliaceae bacterium S1-1]